jgi:hypothetical protein
MKRALVISLLILCSLAAMLPIADSFAGGPQRPAVSRRHRRHSRAWWRRHRRMMRQRRTAAARRARLRTLTAQGRRPAAKANPAATASEAHALLTPALPPLALPSFTAHPAPLMPVVAVDDAPAPPPAIVAAVAAPRKAVAPAWPSSWRSLSANALGEMRFSVRAADGHNAGMVTWTRVAGVNATAGVTTARTKTLAGVAFAELRRKVIDRMLAEGGWVVNDLERQMGGRHTFVVVAESANADGAHLAWVFYFTEFNGQIYGLTTSTRADEAPALAADAEQFVAALNARAAAVLTASK